MDEVFGDLRRQFPIMIESPWIEPPVRLVIRDDEVHVWRTSLQLPYTMIQQLRSTLSIDELGRSDRFLQADDRRRFIAARGILRTILSRYCDAEPRELQFTYTHFGKPVLRTASGQPSVGFNVAHSNDLAVYGIARHDKIGIDVEQIRLDVEYEQIIDRFFSQKEIDALRMIPQLVRREAFFSCWTSKEAFIKAIGEGLSYRLDQFAVSVSPNEQPQLIEINGEVQTILPWFLYRIYPAPGFPGTLAIEGSGWHLKHWHFVA